MAWHCKLLPVPWIMLFTCVLVLLSFQAHQVSAEFKFLVTPPMFFTVAFGTNFKLNCTTNDGNATTELYHTISVGSNIWKLLSPRPGKIVKSGPVYTVLDFGISDAGQYQCRATNALGAEIRWSDKLSIVFANPNLTPPLNIDPEHAVVLTTGQSYNITCSSVSLTTLQWFKKFPDGTQTAVPSSQTYSERDVDLNDLKLVLMFKNAQTNDTGTYVCKMTYQGKTNYKYSSLSVYASARFKFLVTPPMFFTVAFGTNFKLNCTTNDGSATTELYHTNSVGSDIWKLLSPRPGKIVKSGPVYTVLDFGISDAGQYQCRATNALGAEIRWSDQLSIVFANPNLTPPLNIDPEHAVVLTTGQSYNITCSSVSLTTLQWFKKFPDGTQTAVPSSQTYSERDVDLNDLKLVLMFKNAQTNDAGTYVCKMTYQGKTNYKYSSLHVYGHELPKILSSSSSRLLTIHNKTTLHCSAYGHPRPDVFWYKDDKQIEIEDCQLSLVKRVCQDKKYKLTFKPITKHTEINSSLTILETTFPSDHGRYTCKAVNTQGTVNKTVFVDVQIRPVILHRGRPFYQSINKPSQVECKIKKSNPPATISWQYQPCVNPTGCSVSQSAWMPLSTSLPPSDITTNHSQVNISKEQESAFYKCTAKNKYGTDSLVLQFLRTDKGRKLVDIKYPTKPQVLIAGDPIRIGCLTLSQGAMFNGGIEWYRGSNLISPITDPRVNVTNVKFDEKYTNVIITIINTTRNDSGLYTCGASFLRPKIFNDTIMFTVKGRVKPTITGLVLQEVTEKSPGFVEFVCEATTANPKAAINWYKKEVGGWKNLRRQVSKGLSSTKECKTRTSGFYIIRNDNSHLVICKPKHKRHTGLYRCSAENSEGRDQKEADLNVLASPTISIQERREIKVDLGMSVNETCRATGNPLPDVVWTRTDDPNREVLGSGKGKALLEVKDVQEKDYGNYTCNATNTVMSINALLTIKEASDSEVLSLKSSEMSTEVLIGIICGCVLFVLIVSIICFIVYRRQKKQIDEYKELYFLRTGGSDYKIDPDRSLLEQCNNLPYDLDWEFPEERLILGKPLGSGAFGQVLKAEAIGMPAFKPRDKTPDGLKRRSKLRRSMRESRKKNEYSSMRTKKQTVAVKSLKEGATQSDYKDLASELKILIHLGEHKNIVNVLGACTRGRRLLVIIEYAPHGDLLSFLRARRDIYDPNWVKTSNNPDQEFTLVDLGMTAYQISRGMEFLASRKCVHRDLAARNVLVGQNYVMKISDFGLARDIYQDDLYVKTTSGLLPVKWMALESLFDRVYTEKSDVWSFGVMLWEIFTLGGTPYPGLPTEQLLDYLSEGNRMKQPQGCPLEMYTIMRDCWIEAPEQRPNFVAIAERLGKILEKNVTKENPYIQLEVDEDSGTTNYYLNPCDFNISSRETADGYEEALPIPQPSTSYNSPLPTIPSSEPESPGYEMPNSPLPSIPPTYEEAIQKSHANPEYRNVSESSNESGIGIDDKDKDREAEENEPLLVQLGYDEPAFSPSKKDKNGKRNVESSV